MSTLKVFCVVFTIHLIPIVYIFFVSLQPEGGMAWMLFAILDFPASLLYYFAEPLVGQLDSVWQLAVAHAIFFQIVGSINWLLIYLAVKGLLKIFRRATRK
jgi:hypothetical protein